MNSQLPSRQTIVEGHEDMNLGFIGTGALTSAIVSGLKSVPGDSVLVYLSPRNEKIAATLAAAYPDVRVASDNQAVLDNCDTIMLAVRPQVVHQVLPELNFRRDHHVVSLIATLSRAAIVELTAPAEQITKALPMPMIAYRLGGTIISPPHSGIAAFFGRLGKVIEVEDLSEFDALSVATATFAAYFKYLETIHRWLKEHGVADSKARDYVATLYKALASAPDAKPDTAFMDLGEEYATRDGINEQVLRDLMAGNVFELIGKSMDSVYRRISAH
jgi:pyrroline-5-carboxylate reductase